MRPNIVRHTATAIALSTFASVAGAGEVRGPPPSENYTADEIDIHARSACVFSGLNDSPGGDPSVGDPGGIAQSFGYFFGRRGFPVSNLDPQSDFLSPGFSCNPNRGEDLHNE